jgi:hypothetical protein
VRVLIESDVWHLDVDSDYPPGVGARKGMAVRRLKINASWVSISPLFFFVQIIIIYNKRKSKKIGLIAKNSSIIMRIICSDTY